MAAFHSHNASEDCSNCECRHQFTFCNFKADALADFAKIGVVMRHACGAKLFSEGEAPRGVYVICFGQVKISTTSRDGNTMILKIASPGDVLGLSALLANVSHEATAEALQPCQIKAVGKREFIEFLGRHGIASMHAAQSLCTEYLDAFHDAQRLALPRSAAGKVARLLLDWGRAAADGKPEIRFTVALTHEEIANMAGMSRETVTRTFNQFRRNQWITIHGASVTIVRPDRLEWLAA
jgi:CRP/FNR family cyclic AMP-dependent transcriptional regulator